MAVSGALKLKGPNGTITLTNSVNDIRGDYDEALVINSNPKSIWIIYNQSNMGHIVNSSDDCTSTIIKPNDDKTYTSMKPHIHSAQGFDSVNPGIILFEHSNYRGYGHKLVSSEDNLTCYFPQEGSISSAIVTGGVWSIFTETNCAGTKLETAAIDDRKELPRDELGPGTYDFGTLKGKSVKYIRPSEE